MSESERESSHSYEQDTAENSSDSENDIALYSYEPTYIAAVILPLLLMIPTVSIIDSQTHHGRPSLSL